MCLEHLGYAVTAHRAQGITTDTSHVLAGSSATRENLYVAMTRGRHVNLVYVATDRPHDNHDGPRPADDPEASARTVLYGLLQHVGAELSAHETITAEQEAWGAITQLAAEYETIAQAAQHDRFTTILKNSGLTDEQEEDAIRSDTFGALAAELRRAEANHHNVDTLMPRLIAARELADADDIAAVLHHRLARATVRHAGSGQTSKPPRLIAGFIPEATGAMSGDMRKALAERRDLIQQRADAVFDKAVSEGKEWTHALGEKPVEQRNATRWRRQARIVAAYRDRYGITSRSPLGAAPGSDAQKIDSARAKAALSALRRITEPQSESERTRSQARTGRGIAL